MRRDQTMTIGANFPIVKDIEAKEKQNYPQVVIWGCRVSSFHLDPKYFHPIQDYSENFDKGTDEVFSARFQDKQSASDFCQMVMGIESKL